MNPTAIPPEALARFRQAAALLTRDTYRRASRLLILKEEIVALRKRGVSYRSISELLTQSGISTSNVSVMKFCHRFLNQKRQRKASVNHGLVNRAIRETSSKSASSVPAKSVAQSTHAAPLESVPTSTETSAFAARGPRIAKVEQLPPGEAI